MHPLLPSILNRAVTGTLHLFMPQIYTTWLVARSAAICNAGSFMSAMVDPLNPVRGVGQIWKRVRGKTLGSSANVQQHFWVPDKGQPMQMPWDFGTRTSNCQK